MKHSVVFIGCFPYFGTGLVNIECWDFLNGPSSVFIFAGREIGIEEVILLYIVISTYTGIVNPYVNTEYIVENRL